MPGLFEQVVRKRHRSSVPLRVPHLRLLRFASKAEIGLQPQLIGLDPLLDGLRNAPGGYVQPGRFAGWVGEYNPEEQRLFAGPVGFYAVHDAFHVRPKHAFRLPNGSCEPPLIE